MKNFSLMIVLLFASINLAWACGHPPPQEPMVWKIDHGEDPITGKNSMWIGVEIDPVLFPITQPTVCSCGIGLGGVGLPFVPSLDVTDAMLAITNMLTHEIKPLVGFDFAPDTGITEHASNNALIPGQQWSGFSALVSNFVQPEYLPNEVLKLWFNVEVDPVDIPLLWPSVDGKPLGFSIGGSPEDPHHTPQQFTASTVPEPATALIFAAGLICLSRKKLIKHS